MTITLRQLNATDAENYQQLRLISLQNSPLAFGKSDTEELNTPLDFIVRLLDSPDCAVYGAMTESGQLIGLAGFRQSLWQKKLHKGNMWGVYVKPDFRKQGIGKALCQQIIAHAKTRVNFLQTEVVSSHQDVLQLYINLGFAPYGQEPKALAIEGQFFDLTLLQKDLTAEED